MSDSDKFTWEDGDIILRDPRDDEKHEPGADEREKPASDKPGR